MTTSLKKDEIGGKIPQIKVDWTPTTGLRGLCAIQIVIGHFFYGFAPRSTHEHCFNDFNPITGEQTAIGDPNYPYLVNLPMNQAVVLFFILSGCLYGYLYFDRFQGAEQKIPFEDEDHNDDHHYLPSASENSTDDLSINKLKEPLLLKSGYEVGMGAEKVEKPRPKSISLREFSVKRLARLIPIWYMSLLIMLPFWLLDERLPWINKLGGALTNIFLTQSVLGAPNGFIHTHPVMIGPGWQISAFMLSYLTLPSMVKWTKVLILACHSFRKRVWGNNTTSTNHGNNYSPNSANSRVRIQVSLFFYLLLSPEGILLFLMLVPAMIIPWWLANWVANLPNSNFGVSHCTWIVRVWIVWQGVWLGMLIKRRDEWGKLEWKHSNDTENLKTNLNVNADSMRDSMMERRKYKSVFHFYHAWSHMQGSLSHNAQFLSRKFLVNSLFGLYVGYFFIYPIVGSESFDMFAEYFTPPLQLLWFYVLVVSVKEEEPLVLSGSSTGANVVPFCPRFLNSSVFQKLGDYSYGVYCGHFPCFWIVGWVLTPGFPFGKGAGYYVLNRCLNGPSMGDGFFGLDYIDFPICLVAALTMAYILVTLDDYLGLRATMEKKFL